MAKSQIAIAVGLLAFKSDADIKYVFGEEEAKCAREGCERGEIAKPSWF